MGSKLALVAALTLAALPGYADDRSGPWLSVDFPRDSPVDVVSFNLGDSTATVRGISLALGIHSSLVLRNVSKRRLSGLTLLVEAQDLTPAGRGSVTVPSLSVQPGEIFPVRLDLELLRPFGTNRTSGALVQVSLDCALFDDLSAYGPDKLHSRRNLTVYELEARRDRRYFKNLIRTGQVERLQSEMNFGMPDVRPAQLGFEILTTTPAAAPNSRAVSVAFVPFPDAPVEMLKGAAHLYRNEIHAPQIELQNRTGKTLDMVEIGWILRDDSGRDYVAGSLPAIVRIGPVQQARVLQGGVMRFTHPSGRPMLVDSVAAFISNVQFSDGNVWIPSRADLADANFEPSLRHVLASSPEQQRLREIYRRKGLDGLTLELNKVIE